MPDPTLINTVDDLISAYISPQPLVHQALAGVCGAVVTYLITDVYEPTRRAGAWTLVRTAINPRLVLVALFGAVVVTILISPTSFQGGVIAGFGWERILRARIDEARQGLSPQGGSG